MSAMEVDDDLRGKIANAKRQLEQWRRDGNADKIHFWARELDELIDKLPRETG
jgi:hypothetical protein